MLWKKESEANDALYIDLCTPSLPQINEFKKTLAMYDLLMDKSIERNFIAKKDNDFALKLRQEGNALFASKKWDQAMDKYNRSLCFAENDSEHIALAFANRSSCYFRLNMFDKCLIDIDLAKKAKYPEHLEEKLRKRATDCLQSIDDGAQAVNREAKLSHEPHQDYPGMINSSVIVFDAKYGRSVVTTKDVDVGDVVLLEQIYFGESYVRKYETCTVCLRSNINLVPCTTCTFAMICYDGCKNADFHRLECGIRKCPNVGDNFMISILIPIVRSLLIAIKLFPNASDLMNFVEGALASDPMEIPTTIDDKSMYRAFLKIHKQELDDAEPHHIHFFYNTLLGITEVAPYFSHEEKYRRFFMHLSMHHLAVYKSNKITNERLIGTVMGPLNAVNYIYEDEFMGILKTYFNHSCAPNIAFYLDNGSIVGKIIRPVKNGEQLFVSYFTLLALTLEDRQTSAQYGFKCDCFRCKSGVDDNTDADVDMDFGFSSDYLYLRATFSPNRSYPDESQRKGVEEKCVKILKKWGRNKWSYSLEYVMEAYVSALQQSTTSPISKYHYMTNIVEKPGLDHNHDMFEQAHLQAMASLFNKFK